VYVRQVEGAAGGEPVATTPSAPALTATTCTIAQGQSESAEVDLGGRALVAIVTPAAIEATTAQVSLKHGVVSGTRYPRQSALGTKQTFAISTTNRETFVEPSEAAALHYVSIVAETAAGAAVVQATAERGSSRCEADAAHALGRNVGMDRLLENVRCTESGGAAWVGKDVIQTSPLRASDSL